MRGFMELKVYLVRKRITVTDFAKKIGCSRSHLTEIVNGKRKVGKSLAMLIELATSGEVKSEELLRIGIHGQ